MSQQRRIRREQIKKEWKEHNREIPKKERCSFTDYWALYQKEKGEK